MGILVAMGAAYLGGILASLTPCVYPMIPITLSVVGGLQVRNPHSRPSLKHIMMRVGLYISGMTMVYSALGVGAGLAGSIFGTFTNTPTWYLGLSVVFALSALMMMDVIPFDPLTWWSWIKRKIKYPNKPFVSKPLHTEESTLLGAFTLGISSGFIAAPCTTPVLTAILAYITKTQSVIGGFFLMVGFSLGLGSILVLIAMFASMAQILPKSGHWMVKIKIFSGVILLGFALYLAYLAFIGIGGTGG